MKKNISTYPNIPQGRHHRIQRRILKLDIKHRIVKILLYVIICIIADDIGIKIPLMQDEGRDQGLFASAAIVTVLFVCVVTEVSGSSHVRKKIFRRIVPEEPTI